MVGSPMRTITKIAYLLWLGCLACAPLTAQQILGAVTGTVKDSAGASVPSATVKATNKATNLEVTAKSPDFILTMSSSDELEVASALSADPLSG